MKTGKVSTFLVVLAIIGTCQLWETERHLSHFSVGEIDEVENERAILSPATPRPIRPLPPPYNDNLPANYSFSACLLIRDDNRRLPEWLAYHYTVLPLRRLIIAVDPFSVTDPTKIAKAFESHIGLNTTIWNDEDYMFNHYRSRQKRFALYSKIDFDGDALFTDEDFFHAYIWRQQVFLTRCTQELEKEGRSWIALVDTDEFITFNWYRPDVECKSMDDSSVEIANKTGECIDPYQDAIESGSIPRKLLPPSLGHSTIAQFIQEHRHKIESSWYFRPCIVIPRVLFGGVDSPPSPELQEIYHAHPDLAKDTLLTLRYRLHGRLKGTGMPPGKSIIDVRRISPWGRLINNPHRVYDEDCLEEAFPRYSHALFRANHYTGGMEDFKRIGVSSRGKEAYNDRNSLEKGGQSEEMITWFEAFVDKVGYDRAIFLTQTLKQEAVEEHNNITSILERDNTTKLHMPFMPSPAYIATNKFKLRHRVKGYKEWLRSQNRSIPKG